MPEIVSGKNSKKGLHTMKKGQRHFHEVNAYNPRKPIEIDENHRTRARQGVRFFNWC